MITDTYIAGFFDGEGCVYMQAYYKKGKYEIHPRCTMQISITQKNVIVLQEIQKIYGGTISDKGNCMVLRFTGKDKMYKFLSAISPYVIEKKKDVMLALQFIETMRSENLGCKALSNSIHAQRYRIYCELGSRNMVPSGSDSVEQTPNMLEHPERAISRHRPYGKASETTKEHLDTDGGIVRAAWEHAESGRNDQTPEMGNKSASAIT